MEIHLLFYLILDIGFHCCGEMTEKNHFISLDIDYGTVTMFCMLVFNHSQIALFLFDVYCKTNDCAL